MRPVWLKLSIAGEDAKPVWPGSLIETGRPTSQLAAVAAESATARCLRGLGNRKLRPSQSRRDRLKRRLRLSAVGAAGLGHVGTAAAALAAERFGAAAHEV